MYVPYLAGDAARGFVNVRKLLTLPAGPAHLDLSGLKIVQELVLPSSSGLGGEWVSWLRMPAPDTLTLAMDWIDYGIFRLPGVRPVTIADPAGSQVGTQVRLGPAKVVPSVRPLTPAPEYSRRAQFGHAIVLQGYGLSTPEPGALRTRLHWQALGTPSADDQAFVHEAERSEPRLCTSGPLRVIWRLD